MVERVSNGWLKAPRGVEGKYTNHPLVPKPLRLGRSREEVGTAEIRVVRREERGGSSFISI